MSSTESAATLITGGSRGIGAAIALRLARDGHGLALTYRERAADAETVAAECRALGAEVVLLQADLGDLERAETIVREAVDRMGGLTGLVNNAGITGRIGPFLETTVEESELVFRINVLATLAITRAAIAHFRGQGGGSIVNISSGDATTGAPGSYIPYAMSKAALNALTLGAAKEFATRRDPGEHRVARDHAHRDPCRHNTLPLADRNAHRAAGISSRGEPATVVQPSVTRKRP